MEGLKKNYINLTDVNFCREVLESKGLVLVGFLSLGTSPDRDVAPLIEQVAEAYRGVVKVGKMEVDENFDVPAAYRLESVPAVMFFRNGKVVGCLEGVITKSDLVSRIEAYGLN